MVRELSNYVSIICERQEKAVRLAKLYYIKTVFQLSNCHILSFTVTNSSIIVNLKIGIASDCKNCFSTVVDDRIKF